MMRFRSVLFAFVLPFIGGPLSSGTPVFSSLPWFSSVPLAAQQLNLVANVPVRSPTGAGTRNLTFGTVTPIVGTTQLVNVAAAALQSGEFRFDLTSLRGLEFSLTLPTVLTGPAGSSLAVSFAGTQYGEYCVSSGGAPCTATAFDPAAAAAIRICAQTLGSGNCHPNRVYAAGSDVAINVGGSLSVPPTARAGVYTATITLNIVQVY
ncbi:MAG: hypothetical protein KFH98_04995 [Gemmatimonadetes bacterium]|nr:hypothetical protein [Gemmatimonadota bacterium]